MLLTDTVPDNAGPAGESRSYLASQLAGIATALLPTRSRYCRYGSTGLVRNTAFLSGKSPGARPAADGASIDAQRARDLRLRQPAPDLLHHRFVSRRSTFAAPSFGVIGTIRAG